MAKASEGVYFPDQLVVPMLASDKDPKVIAQKRAQNGSALMDLYVERVDEAPFGTSKVRVKRSECHPAITELRYVFRRSV